MDPSESQLWRDVLGRLAELQDEIGRVEELVHRRAVEPKAPSAHVVAARPRWRPLGAPSPAVTPETAPPLVARLRRQLASDPLQGLALAYPQALFAPDVPPSRVQRECLSRHAVHTARLAMYVAQAHGYEPSTVEVVGLCALLHDLGMEGVPPELFAKAGPLTRDEVGVLQGHAVQGFERLRADRRLDGLLRSVVARVVRQHHERVDASGYPDGVSEPHIHEFARLVALAEAYETMVTPRPYRAPCLPHEAMETLLLEAYGKAGRAPRFDRRLAATFLRALSLYPIGSGVRLDTGETGQVVGANPNAPERPFVRLLWSPDGEPLERPRVVNLREAPVAVAAAVPLPTGD
ncbi:MAG: HD domain-containing phosphohydrolase [Planctomycetota bacterium]